MADGTKNENMGHNESKIIIAEVQKRPPLYDRRSEDYNNRLVKDILWDEVCSVVFFNWNKLNKEQKMRKGNAVRRRWKNLKDCFIRELANHRKLTSTEILERKQYVHFESLFFLANTSNKKNMRDSKKIIDNYKKNLARVRKQQIYTRRNVASSNFKDSRKDQEDNSSSSLYRYNCEIINNQLQISMKNDEIMNNTHMTVDVEIPEYSSTKYSEEVEVENLTELSKDHPTSSSFAGSVQNSTELRGENQTLSSFQRPAKNAKELPVERQNLSSFPTPVQNSTELPEENQTLSSFPRPIQNIKLENSRLIENERPIENSNLPENIRIRKRKIKISSKKKELLNFLKSTEEEEKSFKQELLNLLKLKEEKKSENELFAALIVSIMDKLTNEQSHYVKMEILNVLGKAKNYHPPSYFTVINGTSRNS